MLQNLRSFFRTHRKQLRTAGIFFLLGLAYYIVTQLTPLRIPCLFQKITGLACPGCGISHFCIRLLHLDLLGAAKENLAITLLSPLWLGRHFWFGCCGIQSGSPRAAKGKIFCCGAALPCFCCSALSAIFPIWNFSCRPICNSTPFSLREYNKTVSIIFENHGHTKSVITQNHSSLCFLRQYCTRPVRHCLDR